METEFHRDVGERVASGFGDEGGAAAEAGVDFHDAVFFGGGVKSVLDVAFDDDA